jgi:hypothetical protein
MSMPMQTNPAPVSRPAENGRWVGGAVLILIGLLSLAAQFIPSQSMGQVFLLLLGSLFLIWGIGTRNVGLVVPGGVLSGLGTGVYLIGGPLGYLGDPASGGVIVLSLAAGFVLIALLSSAIGRRIYWWPLIPATVLAFVGATLLGGEAGLEMLVWFGRVWPVALIGVGAYLLLRRGDSRGQ